MQRADKRKYHYIYKITRDDGRYYIGMHSTDNLDDGYLGSGQRITRSIKRHGKERHSKEILEFLPSREELKLREKFLLTEEIRADPMCMNIAPGGDGGFRSKEHEIRFLEAASKSNGWQRLKRLSPDELSKRGKNSAKTRKLNGSNHKTKHTEKTKQKISVSMCGKQSGEKNSQFGSCWVNNGTNTFKIKKEQLSEYTCRGYLKGRILRAK